MKRIILCAYIALLVAVGLPFIAEATERGAAAAGPEQTPIAASAERTSPPQMPEPAQPEATETGNDPPLASAASAPAAPETIRVKTDAGEITMDMQDYLVGVVAAEMPASFHPQALRAQAVAARSYAMYCAGFSKHGTAQVCTDPGCCQAWHSEDELRKKWGESFDADYEKIRSAVDATGGEYLCFGGQPVFAAFHSSSAGATENSADVWSAVPYLVSVSSPETAEDVPNYISRVECSPIDLRDTVLSAHREADFSGAQEDWIGELRRDEAGRTASVMLGGVEVDGKELRQLFSLRSTAFTLEYHDGSFIFTVTGFGHGVGMSQYGADKMARDGADYGQILAHYYPGTLLAGKGEQ